MKRILAAIILVLAASPLRAAEIILPYSAFGPQVAAYELIGMEWWQWDSQGDDRNYPINVVVYWDQTKEETAKRHPVDQAKNQDFRYVEYSKAIEHLEHTIKGFKVAKLDSTIMERALAEIKNQKRQSREWQPTITSLVESELDLAGATTHRCARYEDDYDSITFLHTDRICRCVLRNPIPR